MTGSDFAGARDGSTLSSWTAKTSRFSCGAGEELHDELENQGKSQSKMKCHIDG
jgi:hypothetical protein